MQFTHIPNPYAPLGGPLDYTIETETSADLDVRILDNTSARLYGAKRFAAVTTARFDIAPYLRRALRFTPTIGHTGIYGGAGRIVSTIVQITSSATKQTLSASPRTFLPSADDRSAPALLTSMPLVRLIPEGACDELSLLTDGQQEITVNVEYGPHVTTETHVIPSGGLHIFRLNTADFPLANRITIDAGPCGKVTYSIMKPIRGSVRLAWRSRSGSIEHYSFPIETTASIEATKKQTYGPEGYTDRSTCEYRRKLRSAIETREVLEALSELTYTPEVWLVEGERYTPITVVSDRAVVHNYDTMSSLDVIIRPKTKPCQPWN